MNACGAWALIGKTAVGLLIICVLVGGAFMLYARSMSDIG